MAGETRGLNNDWYRRAAADEVWSLVDELERTLDDRERRLLHKLRLAAESLGAAHVASAWSSPCWDLTPQIRPASISTAAPALVTTRRPVSV